MPGSPALLDVRELDADRAFAARRERYRAAVDELFDAIRGDSRFDVAFDRAVARDLLDLAPGGVDELLALLTVTEVLFPSGSAASRHDLVIVDTAPTGHTLRLLAMPGLALEWVRALLTVLLKYRRVLGLGALAEDLVELSRGLRQFQMLLSDPHRARVVVVTRAAALPRLETARLLRRLDQLGLAVSAVVVNALTPSDGYPRGARARRSGGARTAARRRPSASRPIARAPGSGSRPAAPGRGRPPALGTDAAPGRVGQPPPESPGAVGGGPARDETGANGHVRVLRRAERPFARRPHGAPGVVRHGTDPRRGRRAIALADRHRRAAAPIRRGRAGARRPGPRGGVAMRSGPLRGRRPLHPPGAGPSAPAPHPLRERRAGARAVSADGGPPSSAG